MAVLTFCCQQKYGEALSAFLPYIHNISFFVSLQKIIGQNHLQPFDFTGFLLTCPYYNTVIVKMNLFHRPAMYLTLRLRNQLIDRHDVFSYRFRKIQSGNNMPDFMQSMVFMGSIPGSRPLVCSWQSGPCPAVLNSCICSCCPAAKCPVPCPYS